VYEDIDLSPASDWSDPNSDPLGDLLAHIKVCEKAYVEHVHEKGKCYS
jgi:hypothetical protein